VFLVIPFNCHTPATNQATPFFLSSKNILCTISNTNI
jgi:hypothetical protein